MSPESCVSVGLGMGSCPQFGLGFQPQVGDAARELELALEDWLAEPLKPILCRTNRFFPGVSCSQKPVVGGCGVMRGRPGCG